MCYEQVYQDKQDDRKKGRFVSKNRQEKKREILNFGRIRIRDQCILAPNKSTQS